MTKSDDAPLSLMDALPPIPKFSKEEIEQCKEGGDYRPILFEWYKFVGGLAIVMAHMQRSSPALRDIPNQQFHVLIGLMNRCARLMLSNVSLSCEGHFGEATAIIDRCIFESAVKLVWLCVHPTDEKFQRYLADGLKTELEFKASIQHNIDVNGGKPRPIEARMLKSIARSIDASGLAENEVDSTKKLPDLASMLSTVGLDRLTYIVGQRIGSHHVHGTWPSLLFHYLTEEEGEGFSFSSNVSNCSTHLNQYMFVSLMVLQALSAYVRFAFVNPTEADSLIANLFQSTEGQIMEIYTMAVGGDLGS